MLDYLGNFSPLNWYAVFSVITGVWFIIDIEIRYKTGGLNGIIQTLSKDHPDIPTASLVGIATVACLLVALAVPPLFYLALFRRHLRKKPIS